MVSWVDFNNAFYELRQGVGPFGLHEFVFYVVFQSSIKLGDKATIIPAGLSYKVLKLDVIGGYGPYLGELGNFVLRVTFFVLVTVKLTYT